MDEEKWRVNEDSRAMNDRTRHKEIPGLEGIYAASDDGHIWSYLTNRIMKEFIRKDGYYYIIIRVGNYSINFAVHTLVAHAWCEGFEIGKEVNHKNFIRTDNSIENLEWVTEKENNEHAWKNLPPEKIKWMRERRSYGAIKMNRMKRRLNEHQIMSIRVLLADGISHAKIAPNFGVSKAAIYCIAKGRTYRD